MKWVSRAVVCAVLFCVGCDSAKLARLEKENQELREKIDSSKRTAEEYDLQVKCGKDSKEWFGENWGRGSSKDTILLDFKNHYNRSMNKCFVLVEYHYYPDSPIFEKGSWVNDMEIRDLYENDRCGNFTDTHEVVLKPEYHFEEHVAKCSVYGTKCQSLDEFSSLVGKYMND